MFATKSYELAGFSAVSADELCFVNGGSGETVAGGTGKIAVNLPKIPDAEKEHMMDAAVAAGIGAVGGAMTAGPAGILPGACAGAFMEEAARLYNQIKSSK